MSQVSSSENSSSGGALSFEKAYEEIRLLAKSQMVKEYAYSTLQGTALVHEAWMRVGGEGQPDWKNRRHLFAAVTQAMRRILAERARKRKRAKHGGELTRVGDGDISEVSGNDSVDEQILQIYDALEKFEGIHPRKAELVRLRYFFGLSFDETAKTLDISLSSAKRWWVFSRSWLHRELSNK